VTDYYADPVAISPASEVIPTPIQVTLTESNPNATIYYTTDGSYPQSSQTLKKYTGPFTVSTTTTISAQAELVKAPLNPLWSDLSSATYTAPTAPTITNVSVSQTSSTSLQVTGNINPNAATTEYWVAYGTTTAMSSKTSITSGITGTYSSWVSVPFGGLQPNTKYYFELVASNSAGTSRSAQQSFTTDYYTPDPVLTPGSESFTKPIQVSIAETNPAASIYYETGLNSNPCYDTTAVKYTAPLTISKTTTISAVTMMKNAQGYSMCSNTVSATYILPAAPTVTNEGVNVWTTQVDLYATITANGADTTYLVAYGTSPNAVTTLTSTSGPVTGATPTQVNVYLYSLASQTTYYYQIIATNSLGTTKGTVQSFTTP
jgi:hypothetical protein